MDTIAAQLDRAFRQAIGEAFGLDADPAITVSQNERFGDYQSNAAMGLAKPLAEKTGQKANPRAVAEQIKAKLRLGEMASEISIAGPGFINVRLSPEWMAEQLRQVETDPRDGAAVAAEPRRVVVDYSGPNVAKELHVGHIRSTIIGDALSRILEFQGDEVIRQNHLGDWGTQFGMLIESLAEWRDGLAEQHGVDPKSYPVDRWLGGLRDLETFYRLSKSRFDQDSGFAARSRQRVVKLQAGEEEELHLWRLIVEETRRHFQPLYERLDVKLRRHDERGESFYNPFLPDIVHELRDKGIAAQSEGAIVVWVKGFESPLIIQKSGGGFGYATTDLAAVRYRARELGARRIVYVTDSRQIQHFRQVFATASKARWVEGVELAHVTFGTILGEDNKPFKTRSGETVKLKDLLDEAEERAMRIVTDKNPELAEEQRKAIAHAVGVGAIKYYDLARDRTGDYVFSWEKMLSFDGNTAPYLQNAYVRICSIFRKAGEARGAKRRIILESPYEILLAKHILRLGEILELVSRELKPHHLCTYLYELAGKFHSFYEHCDVIKSEEPTRSSRLGLCEVTARTIALGLDLLGIEHPEQM